MGKTEGKNLQKPRSTRKKIDRCQRETRPGGANKGNKPVPANSKGKGATKGANGGGQGIFPSREYKRRAGKTPGVRGAQEREVATSAPPCPQKGVPNNWGTR